MEAYVLPQLMLPLVVLLTVIIMSESTHLTYEGVLIQHVHTCECFLLFTKAGHTSQLACTIAVQPPPPFFIDIPI